ncbi:MAG TPA: cytochrome d ubiquinol oxidase subunit II [Nitrospiraceae bacterium]|nr:cytochrome d ubiquinol oxidase subunit II [Nitrospiraceae bacterium]
MLELIVAMGIGLSLILYALTGGADFGAGLWDLLAVGERAPRQRKTIAEAIGPIWEANHVWLILVVVLLFTGFPMGFSVMMIALHIPVTVMLFGIVLRGAAFMFRKYDSEATRRHWGTVFGIASLLTPFSQGMILGAITTGQIRVVEGQVVTGFFAGWVTLFAVACGIFALGLFAFLAATYLTVDTKGQPDLQNDFRRRALWSGMILAPIAGVVFVISKHSAPEIYDRLVQGLPLVAWVSGMSLVALAALWRRWFSLARAAAIGQVTLILIGWCLGQYPHLVMPDVTVNNAHAPEITLRLLIVALSVGAVVLLPSLAFLFHVFKGEASR